MPRRRNVYKNSRNGDKVVNENRETSSGSAVGLRDMIIIIAAGSGLVMNVMVGQIYTAPWWIRLASGLVVFGLVLIILQFFKGFIRWLWRLVRG
jgi:hypothetical protein